MSLHIIIGCMFSGKTTKLIDIINNIYDNQTNNQIYIITSELDTRTTKYIHTHTNIKLEANKLNNINFSNDDLIELRKIYTTIIIDEAQFFNNLITNISNMLKHNFDIYIAGLDADSNQQKFGEILDLIPISDTITKLHGYCDICNSIGNFTKRNNNNNNQILIGNKNYYSCVCRKHI